MLEILWHSKILSADFMTAISSHQIVYRNLFPNLKFHFVPHLCAWQKTFSCWSSLYSLYLRVLIVFLLHICLWRGLYFDVLKVDGVPPCPYFSGLQHSIELKCARTCYHCSDFCIHCHICDVIFFAAVMYQRSQHIFI